MPNPISSQPPAPISSGPDLSLDEANLVCSSELAGSSAVSSSNASEPARPSPAVSQLVSSLPPPASSLPVSTATPAPSEPTNTNQQRTTATVGIHPYADAGITSSGDAAYAGLALAKGRDPSSGLELDVASASLQVGGQNEAQVGLTRVGFSDSKGSVTAEFLTARLHGGAHNDDNSVGVNAGLLLTGAGIETSTVFGENSFTAGLAAGLGGAGSVGLRDIDADGNAEVCAKVTLGPATLGFCAELP